MVPQLLAQTQEHQQPVDFDVTMQVPNRLCPSCKGAGEVIMQRRLRLGSHGLRIVDPQDDITVSCRRCQGEGVVKIGGSP